MARDFSYHVIFPDGNNVSISDEAAGYDRFIETYMWYGDLKVEVKPFEFGKGIEEQPTLRTTKLSKLIDKDDLEGVQELRELQGKLTATDIHILTHLGPDWMPPTTYKGLTTEEFSLPKLKKAMPRLREEILVSREPGAGYYLTFRGTLMVGALTIEKAA